MPHRLGASHRWAALALLLSAGLGRADSDTPDDSTGWCGSVCWIIPVVVSIVALALLLLFCLFAWPGNAKLRALLQKRRSPPRCRLKQFDMSEDGTFYGVPQTDSGVLAAMAQKHSLYPNGTPRVITTPPPPSPCLSSREEDLVPSTAAPVLGEQAEAPPRPSTQRLPVDRMAEGFQPPSQVLCFAVRDAALAVFEESDALE